MAVQKQFKNKYKLSKDAIKAIEEQSNNFEVNSVRAQENKIKVMSEILNYLRYRGETHSVQYTELETELEKINKASNNHSMDQKMNNDASKLTQARPNINIQPVAPTPTADKVGTFEVPNDTRSPIPDKTVQKVELSSITKKEEKQVMDSNTASFSSTGKEKKNKKGLLAKFTDKVNKKNTHKTEAKFNDIELKSEPITTSYTDGIEHSATPNNSEQVPSGNVPVSTMPHRTFSGDAMPLLNHPVQNRKTVFDAKYLDVAYSVQKALNPAQSISIPFLDRLDIKEFCHEFHRRIYNEVLTPYVDIARSRPISIIPWCYKASDWDLLRNHHSRLNFALYIISTELPQIKKENIDNYNLQLDAINISLAKGLYEMHKAMIWHKESGRVMMSTENPCSEILNQWALSKTSENQLEFVSLSAQLVMKKTLDHIEMIKCREERYNSALERELRMEQNEVKEGQEVISTEQEVTHSTKETLMKNRAVKNKMVLNEVNETQNKYQFFPTGEPPKAVADTTLHNSMNVQKRNNGSV